MYTTTTARNRVRTGVTAFICAVLLILAGTLYTAPAGATEPSAAAVAATAATTTATATATAAPASIAAAPTRPGLHAPTINWYGCPGLVNGARSLQVAAFVLGYCPSVWFLQATPAGKAFVNAIVNGACKLPWIVRAATLGKYSTC